MPTIFDPLNERSIEWKVYFGDRNDYVASLYSVSTIPHLFMIGRDGKIVANHLGYGDSTLEELVADINRALAAPLPQGP
jgi:hypothetical protein